MKIQNRTPSRRMCGSATVRITRSFEEHEHAGTQRRPVTTICAPP